MPATKTITFASGGTLSVTMTDINYLDAGDAEKQLLAALSTACKTYERNAQATAGNGARAESDLVDEGERKGGR